MADKHPRGCRQPTTCYRQVARTLRSGWALVCIGSDGTSTEKHYAGSQANLYELRCWYSVGRPPAQRIGGFLIEARMKPHGGIQHSRTLTENPSNDIDQQKNRSSTELIDCTSVRCDPQTTIGEYADEVITEETDWCKLAEGLPTSLYSVSDNHRTDPNAKPFKPMFLAYLWSKVEGHSRTAIPRELRDSPELAKKFGFNPEELPDGSTFRRLKTERFADLENTLNLAAEEIQHIADRRGAPIGVSLTTIKGSNNDENPPSKRTINRLVRKKQTEVLEEMCDVALPAMNLPRAEDAVYDDNELLILAAIAAIKQKAAHGSGEIMGDLKNPDPEFEDGECTDPYYADGPTGEILLEAIKNMSIEEITAVMNHALRKTYTRAKPKLDDLDNFDTRVMVALDITYVAYYGERDGMEWVMGTPDYRDKKYDWCHRFATASIVGEHTHYTVAVVPLGSMDFAENDAYPGSDQQNYYIGNVTRRLLNRATEYVDIRMIYADREFHAADVIEALERRNLFYVIPARKDNRIERLCERFDSLKRGYADDPEDEEVYVKEGHTIHGSVKNEVSNTPVKTNIVILGPDRADDTHTDGEPQPFLTNTEVSDTIALDRRQAANKINQYSNRGAIETTYTKIKECAAWTTSKEFEVRWFHFAFACVIYNMWLLVDFLVKERIGAIETIREPEIALSRFIDALDGALITLI